MATLESKVICERNAGYRAAVEYGHFRKEEGGESSIEASMIDVIQSRFVWVSQVVIIA
jgi:hypothetical protein